MFTQTLKPEASLDELADRILRARAVEAVIWGMPLVNFDRMLQAAIHEAGGGPNQIVYWSRLLDWRNQTLTPNPDVIYFMPFFNTRDAGPVVLEIPPADGGSITGSIMDAWQTPLADVGPAGDDAGRGGRYLILPPGETRAPRGYIPLPSRTYQGYALLRSILRRGGEEAEAEAAAYGGRVRLYPLSRAGRSPETPFVDASDIMFDATIPYDLRFFQSLDRMVQAEPWLNRDSVMIDLLKSIGISKGRPFGPDLRARELLESSAREAHALLDARYEAGLPPFYEGGRWTLPAPKMAGESSGTFETPDAYAVDSRGLVYHYAYSGVKRLGTGQFYLLTAWDQDGNGLDGGRTYRLTVPPGAPARQYWSATAYDRATHALIRGVERPGRSSQSPELVRGADGAVELCFGPKPLRGLEGNWVPTRSGERFEVIFRIYGPRKALFDKTWRLPDIEPARHRFWRR